MDVVDGAGLLGSGLAHAAAAAKHTTEATTTAEELREEVFCVHASSHAALFETLLTILVVELAFFRVGKHFVCV